jgi:hypothetical protein
MIVGKALLLSRKILYKCLNRATAIKCNENLSKSLTYKKLSLAFTGRL